MAITLQTERLYTRAWIDHDLLPYNAMNNDPEVCEFFPDFQTIEDSRAFIAKSKQLEVTDGASFQPVLERATDAFVGDIGLAKVDFEVPFRGEFEIGWMMHKAYWGKGYATEMAQAFLDHAFSVLDLPHVWCFTVPDNLRSQAVMMRLGMERMPEYDFEHPNLLRGHPLRPHIVFRANRPR